MTKKMKKALATTERRINNYMALNEESGRESARRQYHEFDKMLDAMYLNDFLNDKEYEEAKDELMKIRRRTLWA